MRVQLFLSITLLATIGALIWVSRPEGPAPSDDELKRELVVEAVPTPGASKPELKLNEGELARAFRVVSSNVVSAREHTTPIKFFPGDSIPGTSLVSTLDGRPEAESARVIQERLRELTASDALERVVLREYVREKIHSTELAREIAVQEMRADNLPADSAWQVDYVTSYMNLYLDSGKNDDFSATRAVDAIVSQSNEDVRTAMVQALLARAHDGSLSIQDLLTSKGVGLHRAERSPTSGRPAGAVEENF